MEPMVVMATRAAIAAGQDLLKAHNSRHKMQLNPELKGEQGIEGWVTHVDRYLDAKLIELLQKSYPKHGFLTEEGGVIAGKDEGEDWTWIIDPLDGTTNFVQGIPHFCISIASSYRGELQHAVIYDPIRDEMFTASKGRGALLNQHRIRVSTATKLDDTICLMGRPMSKIVDGSKQTFTSEHYAGVMALSEKSVNMRRSGSAALDLAYVAAGRVDFFAELGLKPWDIAAGELLVKEAGGVVIDCRGGYSSMESGAVLAAPMQLAKQVAQALNPSWGRL